MQSFEHALLLALEEIEEERRAGSGIRVVLARRVTDPMNHNDLVRDHNLTIVTIVTKDEHCADDSPEMAKAVKRYDEAVVWMKEAQERNRLQRMSGRKQMVLEDTVMYVNNIPFMIRAGTFIEGNTDLKWAAGLNAIWEGHLDVAHNAEVIAEHREYEKLHPIPELTEAERKAFLKDMYDSDGFEGYN